MNTRRRRSAKELVRTRPLLIFVLTSFRLHWRRTVARRDGKLMVVGTRGRPAARRPVSRVLSLAGMAIHLGRPLPDASRDLPGRRRENPLGDCSPCRPYLVLLPVGFAVPLPLPGARCALTAPFHPCRAGGSRERPAWRFAFCGTFPGVAPAGRYPAPCFRGARTFLPRPSPVGSGHPAVWQRQR